MSILSTILEAVFFTELGTDVFTLHVHEIQMYTSDYLLFPHLGITHIHKDFYINNNFAAY